MNPIPNLPTYLHQFTTLNRTPGPVWGEATKKRAPHKPILLLALLDLAARGGITSPFLDVTGDLVELNELFNLYWRRVVPLGRTSSIAFPFSRLDREPFWHLVPCEGQAVSSSRINNTSSVGFLRGYALGARLDDDLFQIIQTEDGRAALREVLLRSCFSPAAGVALAEQAGINAEAYHYSLDLLDQAHRHQPKIAEALAPTPSGRRPAIRASAGWWSWPMSTAAPSAASGSSPRKAIRWSMPPTSSLGVKAATMTFAMAWPCANFY